jgi:hypothetical protein
MASAWDQNSFENQVPDNVLEPCAVFLSEFITGNQLWASRLGNAGDTAQTIAELQLLAAMGGRLQVFQQKRTKLFSPQH